MNSINWKTRVICLCISVLFGWMIAAMALSGTWNIRQFYDCGKIYDIIYEGRMSDGVGIVYDVPSGVYTVLEDDAYLTYSLTEDFYDWGQINLTLNNLSKDFLEAEFGYYKDGELQWKGLERLTKGKNCVSASGLQYNSLILKIPYQKGVTFSVTGMQFREKGLNIKWSSFFLIAGIAAIGCFWLLQMMIAIFRKKGFSLYKGIDFLQEFWIFAGGVMGGSTLSWSSKKRSRVRICLLAAFMLYMSTMENLVYLHSKPYYGTSMLMICVILLVLSIVSIEGPLQKINWQNSLVQSWFVLWCIAVLSDFIVDKRYQFQGFIFIFFVGFFFFVWGNMKDPKGLLQDLMWAGEIVFWFTTVFIYFCRPENGVARYAGYFRNPNIEAAFAAAGAILFLVELDNRILKKELNFYGVCSCVGLVIALDRVWRSDGRTGQLAVLASLFCFVVHNLFYMKKNHTGLALVKTMFLCILLFVPIVKADTWLLSNLAQRLGTEIVYPADQQYLTAKENGGMTVYAAEVETVDGDEQMLPANNMEGRRDIKTFLKAGSFINAFEAFSSGRTLYYLAYIRQMNLFGHHYHARSWGNYIYPHNCILEIMFRYGIFAGIPYVIMLIAALQQSFLYTRRTGGSELYKLYPLLVTVGAGISFMLENGEKPFVWMIWMLFYLGMGILFPGKTQEEYLEGETYGIK